jgi:hypothetical protein
MACHFYSAKGGEMMRRIFCTVAVLLLSGCLLEGAGPLRDPKPFGAQWAKEGVTKEKWLADWVQCGGAANGNYDYEIQKGQSHKEFFEGLNAYTDQLGVCMRNLGYKYLNECDARCR